MKISKKHLLVTLSFFLSLSVFSQNMTTDDVAEKAYLSSKTTPVFKGYKNTQGSVYANKEFQSGSVIKDGKVVANNVGLRYNVQLEEMEMKSSVTSSATVASVVKRNEAIQVHIGNDKYAYIKAKADDMKDGYYQVIEEGDKLSIYKKITKRFVEGKKSINTVARDIPDMYKEKEAFYIAIEKTNFSKLPKGKKKRKKLFASKENEMKAFMEENNLSLRKDTDFYIAVAHYNSL